MKKIILLLFLIQSIISQWYFVPSSTTNTLNSSTFINSFTGICTGQNSTVVRTTDFGLSWVLIQAITGGETLLSSRFANTNTGFAVGVNSKYYRTINGGLNWDSIPRFGIYTLNSIFFVNQITGYTAGYIGAAYKTTNSGLNWTALNTGLNTIFNSIYFTDSNTGYIGGYAGIIKTTNSGINWIPQSVTTDIRKIYFTNLFTGFACGSNGNIYKTTNSGGNWILKTSGTGNLLLTINFPDNNIGFCAGDGVILKSTNSGENWIIQTNNPSLFWTSIYFKDTLNGICSGSNGKILRTTTGGGNILGMITKINDMPLSYSLHQNYPNPFNPVTKIKFDIPPSPLERAVVRLIVYDVLGRVVVTLVNENLKPGSYEIEWDGSSFASGMYLYKLISDEYMESKRMVLIK